MKRIIFYSILILTALVTSCRKVELDPVNGDPVFTATCQLNEVAHEWQAGVEDYYMFSSFEKDPFNVYVFSGSFAKKDGCCGESLSFFLRDHQITQNGLPNLEEALGFNFEFADMSGNDSTLITLTDTIWNANFFVTASILPPNIPVYYEWDFGDQINETTSQDSIMHEYQDIPNLLPVTLTVRAENNSCTSFYTRIISANGSAPTCQLNFSIDTVNNNSVQLTALSSGTPPFAYQWSDSTALDSAFYALSLNPNGVSSVSVTVTDANGCEVSGGLSTTYTPGALPPICAAAFDYSVQQENKDSQYYEVIFADSLQFSKISIVYTDPNGMEYRSDRQPQPLDSRIDITDVEDYDSNEKGQKTKKISLEYNCRIWSATGEYMDIKDGKATIAVAYP